MTSSVDKQGFFGGGSFFLQGGARLTSEASFAIADNGASPRPVIPDDLPADIQHLTNAYKGGLPVIVISHVNWPHFPFRITSSFCKFIVLGFFHMISIHVSRFLRYVVFKKKKEKPFSNY